MITDQDVEKLKETFATKEDFGRLEKRLGKTFATKDEFGQLVEKVDGIQDQLGDLKVEVGEIHDRIDSLEENLTGKIGSLDVKFDAMLGLLTGSMQEHGAGAVHLARHDRQIGALAIATGVPLPD
jgi:methyl-accepting chemotaxis protein